jgi:cysteine desulfurase family protein (TIGR01976 family)
VRVARYVNRVSDVIDLSWVRSQFPAFSQSINDGQSFFDNAGGSFACRQTIDALTSFYTETKVQPYAEFASSKRGGEEMDRSRARWAEALGVATSEVVFGPSTSMNTFVLAGAFGQILGPDDEVIVTNQDHEANTGAVRLMAERLGLTVREWRMDPETGRLDIEEYAALITPRTRLVTVPHASNIVGQENDIARITELAHAVGARVIVDGVSFVPHTIPDVAALDADVYLFSLYKTYSVHQGLMVVRNGLLDELPNQAHSFNAGSPDKRLNPAGPDHAQVAASGGVLDFVLAFHGAHGGPSTDSLRTACASASALWRAHEDSLSTQLLEMLSGHDAVRMVGPTSLDRATEHRCPTIAFAPLRHEPSVVARKLVERGVQTSSGHYYAVRVLNGIGIDPDRGVVRLSFVHYTSQGDIDRALTALADVLG